MTHPGEFDPLNATFMLMEKKAKEKQIEQKGDALKLFSDPASLIAEINKYVTENSEYRGSVLKANPHMDLISIRVIDSDADEEKVTEAARALKGLISTIEGIEYTPGNNIENLKKKAHTVHGGICEIERETTSTLLFYYKLAGQKLGAYQKELQRKAAEIQRGNDRKARLEEQKKIAALQKRARTAAEKGKIQKAESLKEAIEEVYVPVVISEAPPKTKGGVTHVDKINIQQFTDERAVYRQIAEGKLPLRCAKLQISQIEKHILDEKLKALEGVVFVKTTTARIKGM